MGPAVHAVRRYAGYAAVPLAIYLASRVLTSLMLALSARGQSALPLGSPIWITQPLPASPSLLEVSTNWDGQWYWQIVAHGYPDALPPPDARITQSPFAFLPGYPLLVKALMTVTGLGFPAAAVTVSVVAGAVAVVVLHRTLLPVVGSFVATANTALLCAWPGAATLQLAYTEGLALLLVVLAVRGLVLRNYALVAVAALALGLVRPLTLPLMVVVLVHAVLRWREGPDRFDTRSRWAVAGVLAACGVGTVTWPFVVGVITGEPWGYFTAMEAWAPPGSRWGGWFGILADEGKWLLLAVVTVIVLAFLRGLRPRRRTWPPEVRAWSGAYLLFVLSTTLPTIGLARYGLLALVPFWPFPDDSGPESRADRIARWSALVVLLVLAWAAQLWWIDTVFVIKESPLLQRYP